MDGMFCTEDASRMVCAALKDFARWLTLRTTTLDVAVKEFLQERHIVNVDTNLNWLATCGRTWPALSDKQRIDWITEDLDNLRQCQKYIDMGIEVFASPRDAIDHAIHVAEDKKNKPFGET